MLNALTQHLKIVQPVKKRQQEEVLKLCTQILAPERLMGTVPIMTRHDHAYPGLCDKVSQLSTNKQQAP